MNQDVTPKDIANKFIEAGKAEAEIEEADLKIIGLKMQKSFKSIKGYRIKINHWEDFCRYCYEALTSEEMPYCQLRGTGFRSRWYGRQVASAIREKYPELFPLLLGSDGKYHLWHCNIMGSFQEITIKQPLAKVLMNRCTRCGDAAKFEVHHSVKES